MGSPNRLKSCCGCYSLKVGTIIAGTLGILLSIATIVVILTTKIDFKTIVSTLFIFKTFLLKFMMIFMVFFNFLAVDFRRYNSKRYSQNHSHSQSVHDNNSVIALNSRRDNRKLKLSFERILLEKKLKFYYHFYRKITFCSYHGSYSELCYA
jgi:hypothetical protein